MAEAINVTANDVIEAIRRAMPASADIEDQLLDRCDSALKRFPDSPELLIDLSTQCMNNFEEIKAKVGALAQRGDFDLAVEVCENILAKEPRRIAIWMLLGELCLDEKAPKRAVFAFRQASKLIPHLAQPYTGVAVACKMMGRCEEAASAYKEAIRLKSASQNPVLMLMCYASR